MRRLAALTLLLSLGASASAQEANPTHLDIKITVDSGVVVNQTDRRDVIWSDVVLVPQATWLRLRFDEASLGAAPDGGADTILRMTSLLDGAVQHMNTTHLQQWGFSSAYFNGSAVLVEVIADPGAGTSRIRMSQSLAGPEFDGPINLSICGPTDDRLPSDDPRCARIVPIGCTAWLIDDPNTCFLTAGHCTGPNADVCQFNVPLSDSNGVIQHPGPEDQYAIDPASMQSNGGQGIGDDYAYFGCFENTETGLTAGEAQGDWFVLADTPPPATGQPIRITGYGTTGGGVPPEWNQVQKTHVGPFAFFGGTNVQYTTDTTGGNSGSPVIFEDTGEAIGIHTHAGCNSGGGANNGTGINHPGLQDYLANPQGVCIPQGPLDFEYPDGRPDLIASTGATVRVNVVGQNGGTPAPGTGMLHYSTGGGFTSVAMTVVSDNVYDAVFPPLPCGAEVTWYVSAESATGEEVTDPFDAPDNTFDGIVGDGFDFAFEDTFETDMGWTVADDGGLTTGSWERGVPAGGGVRGDPPSDADGSGQCYVTGLAGGDNDIDGGETILTSPPLDATEGDAHVAYWRWFHNSFGGNPFEDIFTVEISDDGSNWVVLETVGPGGDDVSGGWIYKTFRVADFVDANASVQVRFRASDFGGGSVVEAGVDGIRMNRSASGVSCDDGDDCPDPNGDGTIDVSDVILMLAQWGACDGACEGDVNGDGVVDVTDLITMLAAWGDCP